jgi:hypothetical protein
LRDIVRRQPLPGYRLLIERDGRGHELLAFAPAKLPTEGCGQSVSEHVPSGTQEHVPSGTAPTCYQEPKRSNSPSGSEASAPPNSESNLFESNSSEVGCRRDGGRVRGDVS